MQVPKPYSQHMCFRYGMADHSTARLKRCPSVSKQASLADSVVLLPLPRPAAKLADSRACLPVLVWAHALPCRQPGTISHTAAPTPALSPSTGRPRPPPGTVGLSCRATLSAHPCCCRRRAAAKDVFDAQPPITAQILKVHVVQHTLLLLLDGCRWSMRLAASLRSCPGEWALGAQGGCLWASCCMRPRSPPKGSLRGLGATTWPAAG